MEEGVDRFGAGTNGEDYAKGGGNSKEIEEKIVGIIIEGNDNSESNSAIFVCVNEL